MKYPNRHDVMPHMGGVTIGDDRLHYWTSDRRVLSPDEAVELAGWLLRCAEIVGEADAVRKVVDQVLFLRERGRSNPG